MNAFDNPTIEISPQRAALSANASRACASVQCARFNCAGIFRCGAVSLTHFVRTLWTCEKIAAIVRVCFSFVPSAVGSLAFHAAGSRC